MKRALLSITVILFSFAAIAQPQKVVADKIIAVVGDKIILKSDVDNYLADMQRQGVEIPANGRCAVLEQTMGVKALVLQAEKDSLPITDEEIDAVIDNKIRYFISAYGGKDELEKIAGKSIYQLKEDFKTGIRDQKLAEAERNKIVENIRITPKEVQEYFDKLAKDSLPFYESEMEISQIVLYPKAGREAEEYAIERLKDIKQQVESGKKEFKDMADIYSKDPAVKENHGKYEINRDSKEMDGTWLAKAFTLKEGQISNPFKTKFGYHIIKLESRAGNDAVVRHILIPAEITADEVTASTEKLDSIRSMLIAGTISFNAAVLKYSEDDATKHQAGSINSKDGTPYLTIDQLDPQLVTMLKTLKVGQYSQVVKYKTEGQLKEGIRIVTLQSKSEPHRENMKDDYNRISLRALEEKKNNALENWFDTKISSYYIMVDDEFKSCDEMKKWVDASNTGKK